MNELVGAIKMLRPTNVCLYVENNNRQHTPQQWIFGGKFQENGEWFLVQISNCRLMQKNSEHLEDESTIYSECWKEYNSEKL